MVATPFFLTSQGGNMRRVCFLFLTIVIASVATPTRAQQPERFKLEPVEFTLQGVCNFDVHVNDLRVHANNLVFFDKEGDVSKAIIAGNIVTRFTNTVTGASLTLNISGQFFITPNPDGSQTFAAHGRNVLFTVEPEPLLIFHRGRGDVTFTPTEDGFELVVNELRGQGFDICGVLAGPA
jgi:hypothetical protein